MSRKKGLSKKEGMNVGECRCLAEMSKGKEAIRDNLHPSFLLPQSCHITIKKEHQRIDCLSCFCGFLLYVMLQTLCMRQTPKLRERDEGVS